MGPTRNRRRPLSWLLAGLIALAVLAGLAFYRPFEAKTHAGVAPEQPIDAPPAPPPPPPLPVKRTTFLVMGVDKRGDDTGRADSMMLVAYDPDAQSLSAVSVPRDLWAQIPGHGYDKVNHSYAYGGEKLAIQTVEALVGIPIDHYVTVTFQDFAKIVDAVGGIEVDAEKRMEYHDPSDYAMGPDGLVIDIQPGLQIMDGLTALKYSRFRSDNEGDIGRVRRQQQVAKALMKTATNPAVWSRAPQIISALGDAIDTSLSVADMVRLGLGGRDALARALKTGTFQGEGQSVGGIFYLIPDLVLQRKAAYEVLVGSPVPESFLNRAREDQATYAGALAEAVEADRQALARAEAEEKARQEAGAGDDTPAAVVTKPPVLPSTGGTGQSGQPKQQPVTVAVIDASGGNISADYVQKLRAAGFRVARVSRSSQTVNRTTAIVRAERPGMMERILAVLPTTLTVTQLDQTAEVAVEIVLGKDLLPKTLTQPKKR